MAMYSAEVLSQLRTLNWLTKEQHYLPPGSAQFAVLQAQLMATRERLPHAILTYHDRLGARGKPSVATLSGSSCGGCHLKLPSGMLAELRVPGRFGVCPSCGVFVWSGDNSPPEPAAPVKNPARKKPSA